ncbi:hypothetical protein AVEN_141036-1, partial [Araneus ventricosus]
MRRNNGSKNTPKTHTKTERKSSITASIWYHNSRQPPYIALALSKSHRLLTLQTMKTAFPHSPISPEVAIPAR